MAPLPRRRYRRLLRWLVAAALVIPLALQLALPDSGLEGLRARPGIGAALGFGGALGILLAARLLAAALGRDKPRGADHD